MKLLIKLDECIGKTIEATHRFEHSDILVFTDDSFFATSVDHGYDGDWEMCDASVDDFDKYDLNDLITAGIYSTEEVAEMKAKEERLRIEAKRRSMAEAERRERAQFELLKAKYGDTK